MMALSPAGDTGTLFIVFVIQVCAMSVFAVSVFAKTLLERVCIF